MFAALCLILFGKLFFHLNSVFGNFGDLYLHYFPLKYLVSEHLISGKMPLWNPYIFAGQPLLANPQSAVFYPFTLLFCLAPLPFAFNLFVAVHFFLAGLFAYIFLSSLNLSRTASALGSLALAFSSFLIYKVPAGHPIALSGYIWLPVILMLLNKMAKEDSALWLALFSLSLAIQFLSGHTQPVFISLTFIAFHLAAHKFSYWKKLLIAAAFTILLSSFQLIPTMELSNILENAVWPRLAAAYSLPLGNLVNILLPNYFGNILDGTFIYPGNASYFFERHALYFGVIPALLAMSGIYFAFKHRRFFWPLTVISGLLLSFGFALPFYEDLYWFVPGMKMLRVPARFYFMALTGLTVLAAGMWDHYFSRASRYLKFALLAVVAADLLFWGGKFIYSESLAGYRKPSELTGYFSPFYRVITQPEKLPSNKSMLYHHYNLNGYEAVLLQDYCRYLGLQEKNVLSTTGLARHDFTSPLIKGFSAAYLISADKTTGFGELLDARGGTYIYHDKAASGRIFLPKTVAPISEGEGFDQINYLRAAKLAPQEELMVTAAPKDFPLYTSGGRIVSFFSSSDKISAELILNGPSAVVIGDIFYPGWKAYADSRSLQIVRGNKSFRTVFLNSGEYTGVKKLYLVYDPASLRFGLILFLLSLISLAVYLVVNESKREKVK